MQEVGSKKREDSSSSSSSELDMLYVGWQCIKHAEDARASTVK